ncbi:MAG: hypothetical protein L6U99_10985 [Clostridium sp.]|nr:MAG: hypothetical protein L6U99_10985 [Clostridium sp.]
MVKEYNDLCAENDNISENITIEEAKKNNNKPTIILGIIGIVLIISSVVLGFINRMLFLHSFNWYNLYFFMSGFIYLKGQIDSSRNTQKNNSKS